MLPASQAIGRVPDGLHMALKELLNPDKPWGGFGRTLLSLPSITSPWMCLLCHHGCASQGDGAQSTRPGQGNSVYSKGLSSGPYSFPCFHAYRSANEVIGLVAFMVMHLWPCYKSRSSHRDGAAGGTHGRK